MLLQNVPGEIDKLVKKHDTNDPFEIAKNLGIQVLYNDFGDEVYAFYNRVFRIKFIHLSNRLNYEEMLFACAHELFHAIYHPDENTPKLSKVTLNSTSKIEAQANCGATWMLIDGSHTSELYRPTKRDILNYYALPLEMEIYL